MGRIGLPEILVVLVIVLIIFGPKKLPELARGMGEAVKEFRKGQKELEETINEPVFPESQKTETKNAPTVEANEAPTVANNKKDNE